MPRRSPARALALLALVAITSPFAGCASSTPGGDTAESSAALTAEERMGRYVIIRDVVTQRGMPGKGYLWAGIAWQETGLVQCWSEATWACQGPNSPDCGGGPVIAGAGDGPCDLQQGGLGMFQFDGGTFAETLARDGDQILTVAGNVNRAVDFVINMVKISAYTTNAETDEKAVAWINNFDINNATLVDQWVSTVTHYYNGCKPSYSCWSSRYQKYHDGLFNVLGEAPVDWWGTAPAYKASFVSQSFPYASQPFVLTPGQIVDGYIELKNDGTEVWRAGEVFLGTTEPRDGASPLAAPSWVAPNRAATVDKETPPGSVARFNFAVKGPAQLGEYPQFFNLLREGVAWFSDGGQGGPPDNQLEVKVTVEAGTCPAGVGADWVCQGDKRVRCEPSTGAVSEEPCASGCTSGPGGATCAAPGGAGGMTGAGGGSTGQAGATGTAGSAGASQGQAGASQGTAGASQGAAGSAQGGSTSSGSGGASQPGNAGSGGQVGAATGGKASGGASSTGKGGGASAPEDESVVVINNSSSSTDEGGCSTSPRRAGSLGGAFAALALLGLSRRRRR